MSNTVHAFDFLSKPIPVTDIAVCVLFGDEPFLKRLVRQQILDAILGDEDVPYGQYEGASCEWRDVVDELATVSLFGGGGPRLALVDEADAFVSKNRSLLEDYVAKPKRNSLLILDVGTWQGNTRLYKSIDKSGLQIECKAPMTSGKRKSLDEKKLTTWLTAWCKNHHGAKLDSKAADLLLELVGPEFGLLDQGLAKLSLFVNKGETITPEMVTDIVGGWRTKTIWELLDAAAEGDSGEALLQLDRLLQSGSEPIALFGSFSWSLRRFATATRIYQQSERRGARLPLRQALIQAGFREWPKDAMQKAEKQLKQLGRDRAGQFYDWLLEADLALKGSHSTPDRARFILEQLILRMAKTAKRV